MHDITCSRIYPQPAAHFEEASSVTYVSLDPSSASPCETHPARSALLSDLAAAIQLAPMMAATAAVRRVSLSPLRRRLVGPGPGKEEVESDITRICATSSWCASTATRPTR